jgi:quercetin dioxygenase-like cupin family protein
VAQPSKCAAQPKLAIEAMDMAGENGKSSILKPISLNNLVEYQPGSVVSNTLVKKDKGTITLFAFDRGEGLSEHTAPFDALVQVVDGEADITVGDASHCVTNGEVLLLPAGIPHSVQATSNFKMLLTMIRA